MWKEDGEEDRRKAKQPTGGGGSGGRAGATVGISEELSGEQELGQLLSNLRTESMPSCWICLEEGVDNRQRWGVTGARLLLSW